MELPRDAFMLLSFVNTHLRDDGSSLEDFCEDYGVTVAYICGRMDEIGYRYDESANAFK